MTHLLLVLLLAAFAAAGNTSLRGAVRHVEDAIRHEMMIEPVRYSEPNISVKFQSSARFDPRGMANLYRVTNLFMDLIGHHMVQFVLPSRIPCFVKFHL